MSENASPAFSPKAFPWRTALFVSLGLNILVLGGAIGAFASGARFERPVAEAAPAPSEADVAFERLPAPRAFFAAAPPEARQAMRLDLARSWRETRDERAAVRDARAELYEAAVADTYDAARVKRAFAQVRAANQAALAPFHDSIADSFGAMSAAERRTALDSVFARPEAGAAPAPRLQLREQFQDMPREERRELLRERMRERREQRSGQ